MLLRPSQSAIWTKCAAQPRFSAALPEEPESDPAREGTAAAWLAEQALTGVVSSVYDCEGQTHENGWLIENDMCQHISGYVELVNSLGGAVHAERFVRLTNHIAGTLDSCSVLENGTLYVTDLKYGYDIVEPFENTQLLIYALGMVQQIRLENIKRVVLGIYQPRGFHSDGIYRTWTVTTEDIPRYYDYILKSEALALNDASEATPGKHCKYCPARFKCQALTHSVYSMIPVITDARDPEPTSHNLASELEFLDRAKSLIEARYNAVRSEAETRLGRGEHLPGWYMKQRHGNRKTTVDPNVIEAITGVDPYKKVLRSPAELEKAGASKKSVALISKTPVIGRKLEPLPADHYQKMFGAK